MEPILPRKDACGHQSRLSFSKDSFIECANWSLALSAAMLVAACKRLDSQRHHFISDAEYLLPSFDNFFGHRSKID